MSAKADMPEIDGFIFDMDGTLLHTLPDSAAVTNKALGWKASLPIPKRKFARLWATALFSSSTFGGARWSYRRAG